MNYIDDILINIIFLLFPVLIYLFYIANNKNISLEENNLFLCFSLFTSMYLTLSFNIFNYPRINLFMANIIIVITYKWNRPKEAIILSLIYILITYSKYNLNIYILFLEYSVYLGIYYLKKGNGISFPFKCLIIKLVSLSVLNNNIYQDNLFVTVAIVLLSYIFIVSSLEKGESIMKYHTSYKELMKEKEIKTTLFKITHEIKNPLAVCKGYFDMIDFNDRKKLEKYISVIREEVNHALLIISDFSSLSKINIEKEEIDINDLLEDTLANLKELFSKKQINYEYSGDKLLINADYNRLMQVFINILKNSVEALEQSNNKLIKIYLKENKDSIVIEFIDNGIGMDEEVFKNFKNPFYTTKINGTGLGTVLSNEIVKAHDGVIKYSSVLNKGTKVMIELPKNSY